MIVQVTGGNLLPAVKMLKLKLEKDGVFRSLADREGFPKPSERKKRKELIAARRRKRAEARRRLRKKRKSNG